MKRPPSILSLILFLSILTLTNSASGQVSFFQLIDSAESNYHKKNYLKAGSFYAEAFTINGDMATQTNRYNAACSWSLADKPNAAFGQLNNIITNKGIIQGWNDPAEFHKMLSSDKDFVNLQKDKQWNKLLEKALEKNKNMNQR